MGRSLCQVINSVKPDKRPFLTVLVENNENVEYLYNEEKRGYMKRASARTVEKADMYFV